MITEAKEKISSYLTFKIGEEEYAAHVSDVLNIVEVRDITKMPNAPDYLCGVINLREMVLPIIDTRIKFGMSPTEFTQETCIVVLEFQLSYGNIYVGALVDSVEAVYEIEENTIEDTPTIGQAYKAEFISGVVRMNENFIMILDLVKLFTDSEIKELKQKIN